METITSTPHDSVVAAMCSLNNKNDGRLLTRKLVRTLIESGGLCYYVRDRLLCIGMLFEYSNYTLRSDLYYVAGDDVRSSIPVDHNMLYASAEWFEECHPALILSAKAVDCGRGDDISYYQATYEDYLSVGKEDKLTERCWNRIKLDRFSCYYRGVLQCVCFFIPRPMKVKGEISDSVALLWISLDRDRLVVDARELVSRVVVKEYSAESYYTLSIHGVERDRSRLFH